MNTASEFRMAKLLLLLLFLFPVCMEFFSVCTNWLCFAGLIEREKIRETKEGTNSVCETVLLIYQCQECSLCGTHRAGRLDREQRFERHKNKLNKTKNYTYSEPSGNT